MKVFCGKYAIYDKKVPKKTLAFYVNRLYTEKVRWSKME